MNEKKGLGYVLKNIFFKPALAFDSFKVGSAIVFALVLIFSANIFNGIIQVDTVKELDLTEFELTDEMIEQYRDMGYSEEEIKEIEKTFDSQDFQDTMGVVGKFAGVFSFIGGVIAGIGVCIGWLIKGGIITLVFSFMGTKAKFGETMAIIGLAWIPFFIREILRGIMTLATGRQPGRPLAW